MHTLLKTLSGGILALIISACANSVVPPQDTPQVETAQFPSVPDEPPAIIDQAAKDTCGAEPLKILIGNSIAAVQMPADQNIRIIGVDTMVTKDFRLDRINIKIDEVATITDIYCG